MTTTTQLPAPHAPSSGTDDNPLLHMFCGHCWPIKGVRKVALCGHLSTGNGPIFLGIPPAEWPICVVCMDLVHGGCPKCGAGR